MTTTAGGMKSNRRIQAPVCCAQRKGIPAISSQVVGLLVCLAMVTSVSCNGKQDVPQQTASVERANRIVAVNYGLQYLTQRIVGDAVKVEFPAARSPDPKNWIPAVADVAAMQKADLIVVNGDGAPFAQWLVTTTLPSSKICDATQDIPLKKLIPISDHQIVHTHGPEGEHSHAYMVPHTWLAPDMAGVQAKTIAERLQVIYPEKKETLESNLKNLLEDLKIETNVKEPSANTQPIAIVTTSPRLKYLTRYVGLNDHHLLWLDEWLELDVKSAIDKLAVKTKTTAAVAVVTDTPPSPELQKFCEEKNYPLIQIDLLERESGRGDYLMMLRENIRRLSELSTTQKR